MSSMVQRVITACVAVPVLILVILFLPHQHYLAFGIIVLFASLAGSYEVHRILEANENQKLLLPAWCGSLLVIAAYCENAFLPTYNVILYTLIFLISISMAIEALTGHKDNFQRSRDRMAYTIIQIIYPNLFAMFLVRVCFFENAWCWLLTFFLIVFSSDTFAYLFGMLLGKNNKGIVKVSPNKSVAGFVAGMSIPALEGALLCGIFQIYGLLWWQGLILGFITAVAGTLGDLIESAFKRSASVKDSGHLVPGRGGVMDSIDSLIIACPIYIAFIHFFQAF